MSGNGGSQGENGQCKARKQESAHMPGEGGGAHAVRHNCCLRATPLAALFVVLIKATVSTTTRLWATCFIDTLPLTLIFASLSVAPNSECYYFQHFTDMQTEVQKG